MNSPEAKFLLNDLESFEKRSNEIRIRQDLPVFTFIQYFKHLDRTWDMFWIKSIRGNFQSTLKEVLNLTQIHYMDGLKSASMWVMKLYFSQCALLMGQSFWQNTSLVTHILFELCLLLLLYCCLVFFQKINQETRN